VAHLKANSSGAIADLQDQVAKLRSELASAKSEISSLKERVNQAEWNNKSLQTQVSEKDSAIENLEKQLRASTLRQQQLQVCPVDCLSTQPIFFKLFSRPQHSSLPPISEAQLRAIGSPKGSKRPTWFWRKRYHSLASRPLMSIACLQVKQQELQVDLGKCESRNSELEQAALNKDARIKELEDELRRLNKQLDERGSSSGLSLNTSPLLTQRHKTCPIFHSAVCGLWRCMTTSGGSRHAAKAQSSAGQD
jgi:hypothetical protein